MESTDRSISGLNLIVTCTVMVADGVPSSLVMVDWSREDLASPSSSISMTTISGSQYTRMITFLPLLNADGGIHTCFVSITGFSEGDNSADVTITVNGKWI